MADEQNPEASEPSAAESGTAVPEASGSQPRSLSSSTKLADLTVDDLNSIIASETNRAIAARMVNPGAISRQGAHVNSGPPGFVNGGGHANFDPRAAALASRPNIPNLGTSGVHVNSGPPGFVNGGGHANFDPRTGAFGGRPALGDIGRAGVHVNSGPPGFVNGGGHANFDPRTGTVGGRPGLADVGRAGVHVNSGPPGFVNGGGHANFDPRTTHPAFVNVTLPDGGQVSIPATGPVDMRVRGFHITR